MGVEDGLDQIETSDESVGSADAESLGRCLTAYKDSQSDRVLSVFEKQKRKEHVWTGGELSTEIEALLTYLEDSNDRRGSGE